MRLRTTAPPAIRTRLVRESQSRIETTPMTTIPWNMERRSFPTAWIGFQPLTNRPIARSPYGRGPIKSVNALSVRLAMTGLQARSMPGHVAGLPPTRLPFPV